MNPTQLRIQELGADKKLQFGCIIKYKNKNGSFDGVMLDDDYFWNGDSDIIEELYYETNVCDCGFKMKNIIGKPFDYGRLSYLISDGTKLFIHLYEKIEGYMSDHRQTYQQTVLERPEELNQLILEFLERLYGEKGKKSGN